MISKEITMTLLKKKTRSKPKQEMTKPNLGGNLKIRIIIKESIAKHKKETWATIPEKAILPRHLQR